MAYRTLTTHCRFAFFRSIFVSVHPLLKGISNAVEVSF